MYNNSLFSIFLLNFKRNIFIFSFQFFYEIMFRICFIFTLLFLSVQDTVIQYNTVDYNIILSYVFVLAADEIWKEVALSKLLTLVDLPFIDGLLTQNACTQKSSKHNLVISNNNLDNHDSALSFFSNR